MCVASLTSHEESQMQPNTERESHVDDPSGVSHPYITLEAAAASTRGVAACTKPISRMLRQAPFPEQPFGQAYLFVRDSSAKKNHGGEEKKKQGRGRG